MPRVTDFTKAFGKTPNTIRAWTAEFADYLTEGTRPLKGRTRIYTDEDGQVIALVAAMRERAAKYSEIHVDLEAGDRGDWPPLTTGGAESRESLDPGQTALTTRLTAMVAQFEGELGAVRDERDRLLATVDQERDARIAAEVRAAAAQAQLQTVSRRHWYQLWKPDKPEGD